MLSAIEIAKSLDNESCFGKTKGDPSWLVNAVVVKIKDDYAIKKKDTDNRVYDYAINGRYSINCLKVN